MLKLPSFWDELHYLVLCEQKWHHEDGYKIERVSVIQLFEEIRMNIGI